MRFVRVLVCLMLAVCCSGAWASGPRWVAGAQYFNPAAKGSPVVWAGGQVSFYMDQGALSSSVSNAAAAYGVAQAAAVWNGVQTAVSITQGGSLSEDVKGSNVTANMPAGTGAVLPSDAQGSATNKPVAVILDADGSVIDDIYGPTASDPAECTQNGVLSGVDGLSTAGNITHAFIVINGRCATTSDGNALILYELVRAWGRVLGLDFAQVNESMWPNSTSDGLAGLPVMHALERLCSGSAKTCLPNPTTLRLDDIAGLNQLYPVTQANTSQWPGKTVTASATFTVQGTILFRGGQGMQGVNIELVPLNATANGDVPDLRYTVSAVSGAYFCVNGANPVLGATDPQGSAYGRFGTDDPAKEGWFSIAGIPLPPGASSARYRVLIEPVNRLYTGNAAVGPYGQWENKLYTGPETVGADTASQVSPSGAMQTAYLGSLSAGAVVTQNFTLNDSADSTVTDDGSPSAPNRAAGNGEWIAKLVGYGHTGWFQFHTKANRFWTVEAQSLDETGLPTQGKAATVIGIWDATRATDTLPDLFTTTPYNGVQTGLTTLSAATDTDGEVRAAFTDVRGDGRPDFAYRARLLYADSVFPARLTLNGGPISIEGQGFRPGMQVWIGSAQAAVTSITPTEITAVAPAVSAPTGTVALTVKDPQTLGEAQILDGLSYDAHGDDGVRIISAPSGTVQQGVPVPFIVQVVAADGQTPAANVQVSYTVRSGAARMGCGAATCTAVSDANGFAAVAVAPSGAQATQVTASLADGSAVTAAFDGGMPPTIAATNALYVAIDAQVSWQPAAIVLSGGSPVQGAAVQWGGGAGAQVAAAGSSSNAAGIATTTVTAGPLQSGVTATVQACQGQSASCATFSISAVHEEAATLLPVSGVGQSLTVGGAVVPVVLEVIDGVGHPMAGATVGLFQRVTAWQPPCPADGRCPAAPVIASVSATLVSDANGLVTLTPYDAQGQAVNITVLASVGQAGTLQTSIVERPR